ncbi:metallophosphoesterase [Lapidilactobacillus salsurivasis]
MATYVISDIHGEYQRLMKLLKQIEFNDSDTLYLLGDMIDRGSQGLKILQFAMKHQNVIALMGNHEYMAIQPLNWLASNDISQADNTIDTMPTNLTVNFIEWLNIGGQSTMNEFQSLNHDEQMNILLYLNELLSYTELTINGQQFVLVHAGIDNFSKTKELSEYNIEELIFNKPFYYLKYFDAKYLVTGHTPTRYIREEELNLPRGIVDKSGHEYDNIFKANNHIAIDCGCGYGGLLGAIRLDDLQEFYV